MFASSWDEMLPRVLAGIAIFLCTTMASYLIGWWWGRRVAWREWSERRFLGRVNVSLNSLRDDTLKIRTIFERSLEQVFLNPVAIQKVRAAVKHTTRADPFLPIAREDRWFLLNFILNAVAEHFTGGLIRHDAGQSTQAVRYVLFLTCEQEGEDRIRKVRALMVQERVLAEFPYAEPGTGPRLEAENHQDRVDTLRRAAQLYRDEPDLFIRLEVYTG